MNEDKNRLIGVQQIAKSLQTHGSNSIPAENGHGKVLADSLEIKLTTLQ